MFLFLSTLLLTYILITPNVIHALLGLILLFANFAIFLFTIDLPFLGFAYLLVYIGAICVLFLYVILLLNLRIFPLIDYLKTVLVGGGVVVFITMALSMIVWSNSSVTPQSKFGIISMEDLPLYTQYLFVSYQQYLLLAIFLLLAALAIVLFITSDTSNSKVSQSLTSRLYTNV